MRRSRAPRLRVVRFFFDDVIAKDVNKKLLAEGIEFIGFYGAHVQIGDLSVKIVGLFCVFVKQLRNFFFQRKNLFQNRSFRPYVISRKALRVYNLVGFVCLFRSADVCGYFRDPYSVCFSGAVGAYGKSIFCVCKPIAYPINDIRTYSVSVGK